MAFRNAQPSRLQSRLLARWERACWPGVQWGQRSPALLLQHLLEGVGTGHCRHGRPPFPVHPHRPGTPHHLRAHDPEVFARMKTFGMAGTWLGALLTGRTALDPTLASCTGSSIPSRPAKAGSRRASSCLTSTPPCCPRSGTPWTCSAQPPPKPHGPAPARGPLPARVAPARVGCRQRRPVGRVQDLLEAGHRPRAPARALSDRRRAERRAGCRRRRGRLPRRPAHLLQRRDPARAAPALHAPPHQPADPGSDAAGLLPHQLRPWRRGGRGGSH